MQNPPRIHVAFVNRTSDDGGAARAVERIVRAIDKNLGHHGIYSQLVIKPNTRDKRFFRKPFADWSKRIVLLIQELWFKLYQLAGGRNHHSWPIVSTGLQTKLARFDVIVFNWLGNDTISLKEIEQLNKPMVLLHSDHWYLLSSLHFRSSSHYQGFLDYMFFGVTRLATRWKARTLTRNLCASVAPSSGTALRIRNHGDFGKLPVVKIPYPADPDFWRKTEKRQGDYLPPELSPSILVGFVVSGRADNPRKGHKFLRSAMRALTSAGTSQSIHLLVAGKPPRFGRKYWRNTTFLGDLDDVGLRQFYSTIDILAAPSLVETFGQVVVEAALCETPAIVFRHVEGLQDLVKDGQTGIVCERADASELQRRLLGFSEDPSTAKRMGSAARLAVLQITDPRVVAAQWSDLIRNVVRHRSQS